MRVIIVEDDPLLRDTNRTLLKNNFPDMEIVAEVSMVAEAVRAIKILKPDLVLLDIELADGNCFQVLHQCRPYTFKPVFITAYNQYAIKAIKFSAIDYILKPVNEYEFCSAIQKAVENNRQDEINKQTENFREHYSDITKQKKLVLRTTDAMHIIAVDLIIYCKSDNSYTTFFFDDGQKILVSKGIKEYADLLTDYGFLRPHQSYLVNINAISKIDKADGGFIILHNRKEIPISQRRKQIIIDALNKL